MHESEQTLGIVIPVYNEAENILQTLDSIDRHTPVSTTVWVVGDFEEDTTFGVLDRFEGRMTTVTPMLNGYGRGALNAIKWGLHHSTQSAVLVTMADLSDDMRSLNPMWQEFLSGSDLVCASRYTRGGKQVGGPIIKGLLSRLAGLSLHYLSGLPTKDVTNSFKLYSRELVDRIEVESKGGFEIGMELVVKAWVQGYKISEVPTIWRDRAIGDSRFKLLAWIPSYLHWYLYCMKHSIRQRLT